MKLLLAIATIFFSFGASVWAAEREHVHADRPTPQMVINPKHKTTLNKSGQAAALSYLQQNWRTFQLDPEAANVSLEKVRESLLGSHYVFQQYLNGIPVEGAEIIVSIAKDGRIYRVFNDTFPVRSPVAGQPSGILGEKNAMETGWFHLRVHGRLMQIPKAKLVYKAEHGDFVLIYRVNLAVDEPYGNWSLAIDARDGTVFSAEDTILYRKPKEQEDYQSYTGPISNFDKALASIEAHEEEEARKSAKAAQKRVEGSAMVFDPNPVTTLMNDSLQDTSPASAFVDAYLPRQLLDISQTGGVFELRGPWVEIRQLEGTGVAPSTTTDGIWNFTRGNNSFNDAMVYFHLDQNQRYMQSLGFTGSKGIQEAPIRADSDALDGADQSQFSQPNNLAFGRGCVDDAEDADVILHEYGHSIQYSINNNWNNDGDEGGMGEGFADYWAGTYHLKTPNGYSFNPHWVFHWDGHNNCWDGRRMDRVTTIYDPNLTYRAHQAIGGGAQSDELWSTPLFQSLIELFERGVPIEEVDRIILEAHFGLGSVLKMHVVADATVQAAEMLYPNGPHAHVLRQNFARHNILTPTPTYTYIAGHVPPNRGANDWQSEIQITNPYSTTANITVYVYESDSNTTGLSDFSLQTQSSMSLPGKQSTTFVPGGTNQRWVLFESDQPLAGTNFFMRNPTPALGTEKAGVPLFGESEVATDIIFPHVPADRASFWSGAVLLNPNGETLNFEWKLYGQNGNDLSNLVAQSAPTSLTAGQKYVNFLAGGVFDDSASAEKVSWVSVHVTGSQSGLIGFQLYGYNGASSEVATAGIMAFSDQIRTLWPLRTAITDTDWTSFSILNPSSEATTINVKVFNLDGVMTAEANTQVEAHRKLLGFNGAGGFQFPFGGSALINLANSAQANHVVISSDKPLRIFELAGDNANTILDGSAVLGMTTHAVFTEPAGKLQLFKAVYQGTLRVVTQITGGTETIENFILGEGASLLIDVPDNAESIAITGEFFLASLITRDASDHTLTVIGGKQVDVVHAQGELPSDDHGNDFASATDMMPNAVVGGEIDPAGDVDFFRIVITQAGTLTLMTTGSTDTLGTLFSGDQQQLAENDDIDFPGGNLNFRIIQMVQPGTYYLRVRGFDTETGTYSLSSTLN